MATQIIAVMEHFLVKTIQKQIGMPTWESIRAIHINLNANAASVLINLGGGRYGYLGLTIGSTEYQTLTEHAFVQLVNLGITPPPGGAYELPA
eukprot:6816099-Ditylum_brightwellii.AAC.1